MAAPSVTYTFTNGTTADASQVNQNFTDLISAMTDGSKSFSIDALTASGVISFSNGTDASSTTSGGALTCSGGAAVTKKLYVGTGIYSDHIDEVTGAHGVVIDSVTLKDGAVNQTAGASLTADHIDEVSSGHGVVIDSVTLKDGGVNGAAINITAAASTKLCTMTGTGSVSQNMMEMKFSDSSDPGGTYIAFFDADAAAKGSISATSGSNIGYNTSSDIRLKKDVFDFIDGMEIVNKMTPVRFKWKSSNIDDFGFIAQELFKVEPKLVTAGDNEEEIKKTWMVDYSKITTILVSALKTQQKQLDYLIEKIKTL